MRRGGEGNSRVGDEKGDGGQGIGRRNKGVMREVQYMGVGRARKGSCGRGTYKRVRKKGKGKGTYKREWNGKWREIAGVELGEEGGQEKGSLKVGEWYRRE